MNIANRLTVLRIILAFVFIVLLFLPGVLCKILATAAFIIAAITDFCDGHLARKYQVVTDLGKFLDPLADKILVLSAFIGFVEMGIIPGWMVIIIILRDLLITGIRLAAARQGKVLAAARAGKHKTVFQMISIIVILVFIVLQEAGSTRLAFWSAAFASATAQGIYVLMLITIGMTVYSGVHYLAQNVSVFKRL